RAAGEGGGAGVRVGAVEGHGSGAGDGEAGGARNGAVEGGDDAGARVDHAFGAAEGHVAAAEADRLRAARHDGAARDVQGETGLVDDRRARGAAVVDDDERVDAGDPGQGDGARIGGGDVGWGGGRAERSNERCIGGDRVGPAAVGGKIDAVHRGEGENATGKQDAGNRGDVDHVAGVADGRPGGGPAGGDDDIGEVDRGPRVSSEAGRRERRRLAGAVRGGDRGAAAAERDGA